MKLLLKIKKTVFTTISIFVWFFISAFLFCLIQSMQSLTIRAANAGDSAADEISAKAFLEDLMVRRYTQGLSTIVDRQAFTLGVQLQLMDAIKPLDKPSDKPSDKQSIVNSDMPMDLLVGHLDPEKLLQQFGLTDEKQALSGMLATKRIKSVQVSVGLREDLGATIKADVEKWLSSRLDSEFGKIAKSSVTFVKDLPIKKPESVHKEWFEWLNQFQHLIGELLMALTVLVGIGLWRFTVSKSAVNKTNAGESPNIKLQVDGKGLGLGGGGPGEASQQKATSMSFEEQEDRRRATEEITSVSQKLNALVPKISEHFESIVRSWCQAGEEGKLKLACFAEAVGRDIGKLPIPVDAMKDIAKIFSQMAKINSKEKAQVLEKTYWDLVSVLNLGPEVLNQPFGYLSGIDTGVISQVLMDQNPKMKTLVSLFLPDDVRRKFVKPMPAEQKFELLENAVKMNAVASSELQSVETTIMKKLKSGGGADSGDSVLLDMTLEKIVSSLSILEEIEMLNKLQGPGIVAYKRKYPSLSFLEEWPDDKLAIAMSRSNNDQILTYLRVRPNMKDRMMPLASPIMAEILNDELAQADKLKLEEKIHHLEGFAAVLKEMITQKEVDLTEIFPMLAVAKDNKNNVVNFKSA